MATNSTNSNSSHLSASASSARGSAARAAGSSNPSSVEFVELDVDIDTNVAERPTTGKPAPDAEPVFSDDDFVTVLLVHAYRAIQEGRERRNAVVFFGAVDPHDPKKGGVVTFRGGFARDVPYAVAAEWRRQPQYRSALKIVPNDTPESAFAQKVGLQPRHASVIAAEMEATSDLETVIGQMTPAMRAKLRALLENA